MVDKAKIEAEAKVGLKWLWLVVKDAAKIYIAAKLGKQ